MASNSEGTRAGEFILAEAPGTISRDTVTVTVPASTTLPAGRVLGQIAATGKYVEYDNDASDGREAAAGILYAPLVNSEVTAQDMTGVIINRTAEVRDGDLSYISGASAGDQTAGKADLAALGVKARS